MTYLLHSPLWWSFVFWWLKITIVSPKYFVVVLGLLVLILTGTIIGMTQVSIFALLLTSYILVLYFYLCVLHQVIENWFLKCVCWLFSCLTIWQVHVSSLWQLLTLHNPGLKQFQTESFLKSLKLFPLSGVGQAERSVLGHVGKLRRVSTNHCWAHMGSDTEWCKFVQSWSTERCWSYLIDFGLKCTSLKIFVDD